MITSKLRIIFLTVAILVGGAKTTQAQITPDNTLGGEASRVREDATVRGLPAELIEGGATRGANLFHSFADFNVADLQRVYFANPAGIENILSRVTGGNSSAILGTLGVDGTANLFLLNPNGIVFGPDAQLDITGSFFASTAEAFELGAGMRYSAVDPAAPPLLAVTLTPGLQYSAAQRGEILNAGNLQTGADLTLSADTLTLQGSVLAGANLTLQANDTVQIRDSEAQPLIVAAAGDVLVQGDQAVDIFALNHADSGLFAGEDLILRSANPVIGDAHFSNGGDFRVEQLNGELSSLVSPVDPVIRSTGNVSFDDYTGASLHILAGGSVNVGEVTITGPETTGNFLSETVFLSRATSAGVDRVEVDGSARPVLDIRAGTQSTSSFPLGVSGTPGPNGLAFDGNTTSADISVGQVQMNEANGLVLLTNQSQSNGAQGNITLGSINLSTEEGSGDLIVDSSGQIIIPAGSVIQADNSSTSPNRAGDITLLADGNVAIGDRSLVQARSLSAGRSGDVEIQASGLSLGNRAQIETSALGLGDGGTITLDIAGDLRMAGTNTRILNLVERGAIANGGDTNIQANNLFITNGAGIYNAVRGQGNTGDINLDVVGSVLLDGAGSGSNSSIVNSVYPGGSGNSGDVNINARALTLTDGGAVVTASLGDGDAGSINLDITDRLLISGESVDKTIPIGDPDNPATGVVDVFFLADNTTSMSGILGAVENSAISLLDRISGADQRFVGLDIAFGVGQYNGDPREGLAPTSSYGLLQTISPSQEQAQTAIEQWRPTGGGDFPEANFFALHQVATSGTSTDGVGTTDPGIATNQDTGWRPDARRVVMWFGDASSHTTTVDLDEAVTSLVDNEITVAAINTQGPGRGIDTNGQASAIVNATGGRLFSNVNTSNVTDVVLEAADDAIGIDFTVIDSPVVGFRQFPDVNPDEIRVVGSRSGLYAGTDGVADGRGGDISIEVDQLQVSDFGLISGSVAGSEDGGDVNITANTVDLINGAQISNASFVTETADGGDLTLVADRIRLQDASLITTGSVSGGDAGNLTVRGADVVSVEGGSRITTDNGTVDIDLSTFFPSAGAAGDLTINTRRLITRNGEISASNGFNSSGQSGTLTVNASESVEILSADDTQVGGLSAGTFGAAEGGTLIVNTRDLVIEDGGRIEASTLGFAAGGNVIVNAANSIRLSGTTDALSREQLAELVGNPNTISFDSIAEEFTVFPSGISAFSGGQVNGAASGEVRVNTGQLTIEDGAQISTFARGGANGGPIDIQANDFLLQRSGQVISRSEGSGFAGDVEVNVDGLLEANGGEFSASSDSGIGSGVNLSAQNILLRNSSLISSSVFDGTGGGGDITINANAFVVIEDSDILANAEFGPGGTININSPAFLANLFESGQATPVGRNPGSFAPFRGNGRVDISADSAGGQSGTVSLPTLVTDEGLNELPLDLIDPTSLIDQRCDLLANQQNQGDTTPSQFTVVGRGGLPLTPEQHLEADSLLDDLGPQQVQPTSQEETDEVMTTVPSELSSDRTPDRIIEPQSWQRSADGRLYLHAPISAADPVETRLAQRCTATPTANLSPTFSQ
ncbi:MAG: filamentous hemagglutinin N-terminal domain-containing protein [Cyanobacteria bacterium P01_D01_bin.156]